MNVSSFAPTVGFRGNVDGCKGMGIRLHNIKEKRNLLYNAICDAMILKACKINAN